MSAPAAYLVLKPKSRHAPATISIAIAQTRKNEGAGKPTPPIIADVAPKANNESRHIWRSFDHAGGDFAARMTARSSTAQNPQHVILSVRNAESGTDTVNPGMHIIGCHH